MTPWLTVIGIGDDGVDGLPPATRSLVDAADVVFGSKRILDRAGLKGPEAVPWAPPLEKALAGLVGKKGRNVVVLATGDPMLHGMGATLTRHVPPDEMTVIPAPSAFSLAAARLKWPLQEVECLSLHAHPVSLLHPHVQPDARILALTGGGETVNGAAELLRERGYGESVLTVLEHMGGPRERIASMTAHECKGRDFADFNTLAIECIAAPDANLLPRIPGLPDESFVHDGQLTKREIRAVTLAVLGPVPGGLLWDVGAGCGSIAIEWMRAAKGARAIAFERHRERLAFIAGNATALGTPGLEIVAGAVPETLEGKAAPAAVFLGGAVSDADVFRVCWDALPPGGRLAANAVTLESEAALIERQGRFGGELARMDVSLVADIGRRRAMRPRMSVLQWRVRKE